MRLLILSDLHLDLGKPIETPDVETDVVILAGDIDKGVNSVRWAIQTFEKPTLFILGNHEISAGDERKLNEFYKLVEDSSVNLLENGMYECNDIRFLGCTLWAPSNKRMIRSMNKSIKWLQDTVAQPYNGKTVIITHYPPLHESLRHETLIDDGLAKRVSIDLREFIEISNVSLWVHGHVHKAQDYICGKTRIVCNPRGFDEGEVTDFNPNFVIDI